MGSESRVILYSDGGGEKQSTAASACIIENPDSGERRKFVAFLGPGTNNEAEICAALIGYSYLSLLHQGDERSNISVKWICDSEYVLKSATAYIFGWQRNGWRTADKKPVKNQGLWRAYLRLAKGFRIEAEHVRGHSGHPENEACDQAATYVRNSGLSLLAEEGEGVIFNVDYSELGQGWVLVDGRDFISSHRIDNPVENETQLLVEKLDRLCRDSVKPRTPVQKPKNRSQNPIFPIITKVNEAYRLACESTLDSSELRELKSALQKIIHDFSAQERRE